MEEYYSTNSDIVAEAALEYCAEAIKGEEYEYDYSEINETETGSNETETESGSNEDES